MLAIPFAWSSAPEWRVELVLTRPPFPKLGSNSPSKKPAKAAGEEKAREGQGAERHADHNKGLLTHGSSALGPPFCDAAPRVFPDEQLPR